ncbi:MAG: M20/M25/M40 family metallo-hydrolase, partial [Bacillota bacterium]
HNVIGELKGTECPDEVLVVGGHYDGHDISQSAADNGAGVTVVLEALRALAPHKEHLKRTIRFVGFAQEEMGLLGSEQYASTHADEHTAFMLNLDGAGRGDEASLVLQGWPEAITFFKDMVRDMYETDISVGDSFGMYSDMYPFAVRGVPSASLSSTRPGSEGAPRGYGHTYWDSLEKVNPRYLQLDAARVARTLYRLATADEIPMQHKSRDEIEARISELGFDQVLRYEDRTLPLSDE